jgi:hypothetical protein
MSIRAGIQDHSIVGAALAGLVLAASPWIAEPARAEIIPIASLVRGVTMTAAQCAARSDTVWVTAFNRSVCIRYYVSTVGGSGTGRSLSFPATSSESVTQMPVTATPAGQSSIPRT